MQQSKTQKETLEYYNTFSENFIAKNHNHLRDEAKKTYQEILKEKSKKINILEL